MNSEARIDSMIASMGKAQEPVKIVFEASEVLPNSNVSDMLEQRIKSVMARPVMTQADMALLDILLKNRPETGY